MTKAWIIVAAQPGFNLVEPTVDDGRKVIGLEVSPIIAWAVRYNPTTETIDGQDASALPVTSSDGLPFDFAVREPDGRTRTHMGKAFAAGDDAALIAYFQKREDETIDEDEEDAKREREEAKAKSQPMH